MEQLLPYPWIDPVLIKIGVFEIRWYSIAYILGFACAYFVAKYFDKKYNHPQLLPPQRIDNLLNYSVLSVILGGRLGYVLFYNLPFYLQNPSQILMIWHGGMSFHGAVIGLSLCFFLFARHYKLSFLALTDLLCISVPPGIFFGRIANFINGELWGKACNDDCFLGFVFMQSGDLSTRYASQLYEAFFEGLVMFVILVFVAKKTKMFNKKGFISCLFFILYGTFRFFIEYIREPDSQLGLFFNFISMGQILCLTMVLIGFIIMFFKVLNPSRN